ncbi:MAG: membrane dipeptidase [Parabacteroides sp.]
MPTSMPDSKRLPCIGISVHWKEGNSCVADAYVESVIKAGGAPLLVPVIQDEAALTRIVEQLDGLLVTGGGDLNPLLVGEEPIPQLQDVNTRRDQYDLALIRLAADRQVPMLGICRGHQLINAVFGGSIYQDIYTQAGPGLLKHSQAMPREQASHTVALAEGDSQLRRLGFEVRFAVNSFHHQAVKAVAPEFVATATAPDGLNEAMEHSEKTILSVQWHPEAMAAQGDPQMLLLFRYLVASATRFAEAKQLHRRIVTLDSHTDTPMIFPGEFHLGEKEGGKVNLPLMEEGQIDAAVMVAYIPQGARDEAALQQASDYALERLAMVRRQADWYPQRMGLARNEAEIRQLKAAGKRAILLGVENGYALGKELGNVARFKDLGVVYITLCHNGDNDVCDSARGQGEWGGLSPFGREVVREMNRQGVMVDLSHAAESSFYGALETSAVPIICSHSSSRRLCDHPRNLTDEQLRALAQQGGVAQVCLYKGFIHPEAEKASLSDAICHIDHLVEVAGIDHVGIGSDFDGDGELIGCRASNELINITVRLLERGYTPSDIEKIWGGNFLRVMRQVQEAATVK